MKFKVKQEIFKFILKTGKKIIEQKHQKIFNTVAGEYIRKSKMRRRKNKNSENQKFGIFFFRLSTFIYSFIFDVFKSNEFLME